MRSSFCMDTNEPLLQWTGYNPYAIDMKLYSRWGLEVMTITDPHFVPANYSLTVAGMENPGVYIYMLTYMKQDGSYTTVTGSLDYLGPKCN